MGKIATTKERAWRITVKIVDKYIQDNNTTGYIVELPTWNKPLMEILDQADAFTVNQQVELSVMSSPSSAIYKLEAS